MSQPIPTFHPRTRELLAAAGLAPRELDALDVPPIHTLPDLPGFGLVGGTGKGKTWALVQRLAALVDEAVRRQPDPDQAKLIWIEGEIARDRRILWVNWHDQAEAIHRGRMERIMIDRWIEAAQDVSLLVMDDLGREQVERGNDPARAALAEVLDERFRFKRPVLWTSNLSAEEVASFYRGPLGSRILGTWRAFEVEGQDLRLAQLGVGEFKKASGGDR